MSNHNKVHLFLFNNTWHASACWLLLKAQHCIYIRCHTVSMHQRNGATRSNNPSQFLSKLLRPLRLRLIASRGTFEPAPGSHHDTCCVLLVLLSMWWANSCVDEPHHQQQHYCNVTTSFLEIIVYSLLLISIIIIRPTALSLQPLLSWQQGYTWYYLLWVHEWPQSSLSWSVILMHSRSDPFNYNDGIVL